VRLREWWLLRAERHLSDVAAGISPQIGSDEIEEKIASLRDQLAADNLPNDFEEMTAPSDQEVAADKRRHSASLSEAEAEDTGQRCSGESSAE
jgi:hypothetical protein